MFVYLHAPIHTRWAKREKIQQEKQNQPETDLLNTLAKHGLSKEDLVQVTDSKEIVYQKYIKLSKLGIHPHSGQPLSDKEKWQFQYAAHADTFFDLLGTVGGAYAGQKVVEAGLYGERNKKASGLGKIQGINIKKFEIKNKHLNSSTAKRARKFNVSSAEEANKIVQEALKNGKHVETIPNGVGRQGQNSFSSIIDTGKIIGTKGETHIKIVYDELKNVWTTYPVPKP